MVMFDREILYGGISEEFLVGKHPICNVCSGFFSGLVASAHRHLGVLVVPKRYIWIAECGDVCDIFEASLL